MTSQNALHAALHEVELITDRANDDAAEAFLKAARAILTPHHLHKHVIAISVYGGLVVTDQRNNDECHSFETPDRGIGTTLRAIDRAVEELERNFPAVFRRVVGAHI